MGTIKQGKTRSALWKAGLLWKRYSEHFTIVSSGNQIVICPELYSAKLNWGYVVVAMERANWKSGES